MVARFINSASFLAPVGLRELNPAQPFTVCANSFIRAPRMPDRRCIALPTSPRLDIPLLSPRRMMLSVSSTFSSRRSLVRLILLNTFSNNLRVPLALRVVRNKSKAPLATSSILRDCATRRIISACFLTLRAADACCAGVATILGPSINWSVTATSCSNADCVFGAMLNIWRTNLTNRLKILWLRACSSVP